MEWYFNPRSSCEERHGIRCAYLERGIFQSTLLMRGATRASTRWRRKATYFNPRSSCEERPIEMVMGRLSKQFQSTLLMRGATPAFR